ncbi:MAG: hypothetical protein LBT80_06210 [Lactobacillaceae bacterium]|jgi:hypothetical protein|nr:hypothetical protein [Lactobacillaceae bacterium]
MIKPNSEEAPILIGLSWSTEEANRILATTIVDHLLSDFSAVAVVQGELFKYIDEKFGDNLSVMYRLQPVGPLNNPNTTTDSSYLSARDVVLAANLDLAPFGWSKHNPVRVFAHDGMLDRMYTMVHDLFEFENVVVERGVYGAYDPAARQTWTRTKALFTAHEHGIVEQWNRGKTGYIVTLPN